MWLTLHLRGHMKESPLKLDLGEGKDFLVRQYNYLSLKEMAPAAQ